MNMAAWLEAHGATGKLPPRINPYYTLYNRWYGMLNRCLNPENKCYARYGGAGIGVDARWLCFENFVKDMGLPPAPHMTLDRVDNTKGYAPGNCRWATPAQQSQNQCRRTRVVCYVDGKLRLLEDLARETGKTRYALQKEHTAFKRTFTPQELVELGFYSPAASPR